MTLIRIFAIAVLLLVSGCGEYQWVKPGGSKSNLDHAMYNCVKLTGYNYPGAPVNDVNAADHDSTANSEVTKTLVCGGDLGGRVEGSNCTSGAVSTLPPNANVSTRKNAFTSCMEAYGWNFKPVD